MKRLKTILSASGLLVMALSLPSWAQTRTLPELDPENETGGYGGALRLESADGAGAGHEADTEEAQCGV